MLPVEGSSEGSPTEGDASIEKIDAGFAAFTVGRYELRELVGVGGMGRVFRATDPSLARDVAVKLLRVVSGDAKARMLREARTMAALSHPNVVPIYDVDVDGNELFIAMEFVRGEDLRAWLKEGPHPWREVVRIFAEAGRGLEAAHVAGVVHRDFKPANVLLGDDDRVRVMDFGLARSAPSEAQETTSEGGAPRTPDPTISAEGVVVGTPAYLAPELEAGAVANPATDQYAFCIALHEALYGKRPYVAETRHALSQLKWKGHLDPPPAGSDVPPRLFDVCARGLQRDPDERWDSMRDLIAELEQSVRPRRGRWFVAGAIVAAGAVAIAVAGGDDPCAAAELAAAEAWTADDRAALPTKAAGLVDAHFEAWTAARLAVCEAEATPDLDLQRACLDGRLRQSAALVDVLVTEDGDVTDIARDLPDIGACSDPTRRRRLDPRPAIASTVWSGRAAITRANALSRLGQFDAAREILEGQRSSEIVFAPFRAEIELARGKLADAMGDYDAATPLLRDAYFLAAEAEYHDIALEAARMVSAVEGARKGNLDAAQEWFGHAQSHIEHVSEPALDEAVLLYTHAPHLYRAGKRGEARAMADRSVELLDGMEEPGVYVQIEALMARGSIYGWSGDDKVAGADAERVLQLSEEEYGPSHPRLAMALMNAAISLRTAGEHEKAVLLQERGAEMLMLTLGAEHPLVPKALNGLAQVLDELGRHEEATARAEQGLAVAEKAQGPRSPEVARVLRTLTHMRLAQGDGDAAVAAAQRVLAIQDATGRRNDLYAADLALLAECLIDVDRLDEAQAAADEAVAIMDQVEDLQHPTKGRAASRQASVYAARGKTDAAEEAFKRAVAHFEHRANAHHYQLGEVLDAYARMLVDVGRPADARPILVRAIAIYDKNQSWPEATAEARELLATLPAP